MLPIAALVKVPVAVVQKLAFLPHPVDWTECRQLDRFTHDFKSSIAREPTHPLLYQLLPSRFVYGRLLA